MGERVTVIAVFLAGLVGMIVALFIYLRTESTDYKSLLERVKDMEAEIGHLKTDMHKEKVKNIDQDQRLDGQHKAIYDLGQAIHAPKPTPKPLEVVIKDVVRFKVLKEKQLAHKPMPLPKLEELFPKKKPKVKK